MSHFLRVLARPTTTPEGTECFEIAAPGIGLFRHTPLPGSYLTPGAVAGTLQILNRQFDLVIPDGISGHLAAVVMHDRVTAVQYGDVLFRLVPSGYDVTSEPVSTEAEEAAGHRVDIAGMHVVRASTVGTFYRKPGPDSPNYVEVGSPVVRGTTLGLIEVMKVFNQVKYDLDFRGKVARILVGDATEVSAGQMLFLIEALGT